MTYSDHTKNAIARAREESARLGQNYIGTEHLLMGIITQHECKAVDILSRLEIDLNGLEKVIEGYVRPSGEPLENKEDIPFTPRSKNLINTLAVQESRAFNAKHLDTDHLLLALAKDRNGAAAQILESLGLDYARVKREMSS